MVYWLDANVFITAKNGFYAFDINESLWNCLDSLLKAGTVLSPSAVFSELLKFPKDDPLKPWVKTRQGSGLCVEPSKEVQRCLCQIADYIYTEMVIRKKSKGTELRWKPAEANRFARGADAFVIAHAMEGKGTVVTFESALHPDSRIIRIPDVCNHFGVPYTDLSGMLRELKIKL